MIIVVKSLYPTVSSFDRKATGDTFGCEQFIPIFFAVGQSVFQIEWRVGKDFSTISANKTFRMKCFAHGLQTVPKDFLATLFTIRCQVFAIALFTVKVAFFFYKSSFL